METARNTSESGNLVEKEAKAAEEQIETEAPPAKEENTEVESKPDVKEEKETKTEATASKKKKSRKKKNKKKIIITEEDFGPEVDFTKQEGFVYDPQKAEFGIDEVQLKKRPWLIQDVRSLLYLRRLERRHNKLVHGLASVRKLTPKQILKEEIREITKYNEDMREEKQRENMRNGDYEYVDNDIHFMPENLPELELELIEHEDEIELFVCFPNVVLFDGGQKPAREGCVCTQSSEVCCRQEPPPGTDLHEGAYCWKCKGAGELVQRKKRVTCPVCSGSKIIKSEKRMRLFNQPGVIMPDRRWPEGYEIPGPDCAADLSSPDLQPKKGEAICSLVGKWKIFQKQGGHRFSTDDVTTAWVASNVIQKLRRDGHSVTRHLDLGCGLGSVLMMVGWRFPDLQSAGIEAQRISYELAGRSLRYNGVSDRMKLYHGDLRDRDVLPAKSQFDIITGTPPYFKAGEGALSSKVDQKACLFEFRGGVEDYVEAAHGYLAEGGHFVVVESALGKERFDQAAWMHHMQIVERWDFVPKEGKPPLFSIADMIKREGGEMKKYEVKTVVIRDKDGNYTPEYQKLLVEMGFPPRSEI